MTAYIKNCFVTVSSSFDNYDRVLARKEKYEDQKCSNRIINTIVEDLNRKSTRGQKTHYICNYMELDYDLCMALEKTLTRLMEDNKKDIFGKVLFYDVDEKYPLKIEWVYKLHRTKVSLEYLCASPSELDAELEE